MAADRLSPAGTVQSVYGRPAGPLGAAQHAGGAAFAAAVGERPPARPPVTYSLSGLSVPAIAVPASEHWGTSMIGNWPLQDSLELGALPNAVPCARLHARQILWEWTMDRLTESTELVLSELLTNAVNATRSGGSIGPVRLWLLADRTELMILVWDANPLPPVRVVTNAETEGGRGLMLVDTLARQWDWYSPVTMGGKVVWAVLSAP